MSNPAVHFAAGAFIGVVSDNVVGRIVKVPSKPNPIVTAVFYGVVSIAMDIDHMYYWAGLTADGRTYHRTTPILFGILSLLALGMLIISMFLDSKKKGLRSESVSYMAFAATMITGMFFVFCGHFVFDYFHVLEVIRPIMVWLRG
jgi:hypothetical protein